MEFTIIIPRIPQNFSPIHRTLNPKIHASSKCPNSQLPLPSKSLITPTAENIPTMSEILAAGKAQNLGLRLQTLGPFFRITAKSLESQREIGKAEGLVRVWLRGKILHLESIRLNRESLGMEKSIFGLGLFIGAVAIRYGYDCGCKTAELLAINDSDLYHSKLVRFYTRIGFKSMYEVSGTKLCDIGDMLVWGGIGTRMDADIKALLLKWCTRFKYPSSNPQNSHPLLQTNPH
ncbi:uncharacterized protein LOC120090038 [Benincasa hispida]|uniref:uncharacterized protein LOC120090038 n=1 Tax=Benincasa hispida TaxID=102211 RepID=UPI001900E449|nr:uncharacterized protein LOC120090038 [Benincasa hispida]